jgi:primosomal protein N' (replication factor Y)
VSRARIILLNAALGPLDYRVPEGLQVEPGSIVVAPLGPRQMIGVAWEPDRLPAAEVADTRLRPLLQVYEAPPLPPPLRRLIEWTADYYLAPLASVLRMTLPSTSALQGGRTVTEYRTARARTDLPELVEGLSSPSTPEEKQGFDNPGSSPGQARKKELRLTPQRAQALERIAGRQGLISELAMAAGVSDAVIRGLVKAGAVEAIEVSLDLPFPEPAADHAPPTLEGPQSQAAEILRAAIRNRGFDPVLLDGVTGSGKTEVYFEAVAEALRHGRQTLVLVPEIALTEPVPQALRRPLRHRAVAWHSGLRQSQRRRAWRA